MKLAWLPGQNRLKFDEVNEWSQPWLMDSFQCAFLFLLLLT